ncbi:MAG: ornithine cyclodeaminase family protein [Pararhizobium sp.]
MRVITGDDVERRLPYDRLIPALRQAFAEGVVAPTRHHHTIERRAGSDGTLLLMPAWTTGDAAAAAGYLGVKIVTVNPDNNARGEAAVRGVYYLADEASGAPLAVIDAEPLTARRTAAASALAASFLAREVAAVLLVIGAGKLAPQLVRAHAAVRPIRRVMLWNRNHDKAAALAAALSEEGFAAHAVPDREEAVRQADVVSSATISEAPLVEGAWLKPGAHLDLVGAFTPKLRESDDAAVRRATLFVDTFDGALKEGGDLAQPLAAGIIARADVKADLAMLVRGTHPGRTERNEITLFKSTGAALEDLAAARLVYEAGGS